jgi:LysR family transcriptional regulator, low CO2-responsive transcriptional regulator
MTLVGHPELRVNGGGLAGMRWLVDPTGADPGSDVGALLTRHRVPESQIMVFANEKAAWSAAAAGRGVAPAIDHMVSAEVDSGALARVHVAEMPVDLLLYVSSLESSRRSQAADKLRRFVRTPDAMQAMYRPDSGVPAAKFRPPVYVTLWS